jgi:diguanylate cyclase (GGDEF)-like protein
MKPRPLLVQLAKLTFGAVVAAPLIAGLVAYRDVVTSNDSVRWAEHTHATLEHIALLQSAIENIEGGFREYALSGDQASLASSRARISAADRERGVLLALTADNPGQQSRLVIAADLEQRIIQRGESIARLGKATDAPSQEISRRGRVDPVLAAFRAVAQDMRTEEHRLLLLRDADGERRSRRAKMEIMLGTGLSLVIALASAWIVSRLQRRNKESENKLRQLNRLYAMVAGINALGVRMRDRDDLFTNACRIAVEHGEFAMAWIGVIDPTQLRILPTAWAGADEKTMAAISDFLSTKDDSRLRQTMAARVIATKAAVVSNDVTNDESLVLGKMHAESHIRSIAALPLFVSDEVIGVLVLYARRAEFFDADGMRLLTELAGYIAYALDHLQKQEQLDHLAYYDSLTGLANRRLLLDRFTQHMISAASIGQRLAVFMIDLERFKRFNDTLGWAAGDELLKQVAAWLSQNVGNVNLLARMDTDRFAVICPEVTSEENVTAALLATLAAFIAHSFRLNGTAYRLTAKVGVALFPDDGNDADTVFKNAEAALKKAKDRGEQYLFYADKMSDTAIGSFGFENRLRQALDNGEFVLHYQPKMNLVSGKLTGAEALIRWNDSVTGLVPPGRFIPILEETRLIHDVGSWALHKALADRKRWIEGGAPSIRVAVNVSPLQLRGERFVADVDEAIRSAASPVGCLELEITESLIMENVAHSIVSLLAIRALGVSIAVDDFGTGFSSLSYLTKLPVDTLKIDRSFVLAMMTSAEGMTLVSVIINLAHALKLTVVAEGVETEEQFRQLRLLQCDEVQGFLIGRPVPVEIFEARYLNGMPRKERNHHDHAVAPSGSE